MAPLRRYARAEWRSPDVSALLVRNPAGGWRREGFGPLRSSHREQVSDSILRRLPELPRFSSVLCLFCLWVKGEAVLIRHLDHPFDRYRGSVLLNDPYDFRVVPPASHDDGGQGSGR